MRRAGLLAGPAGWALALLTGVNLLNYLDRYVVAAVAEGLRRDLALSDLQLGLLPTAFIVVYTLGAPVFGALGDRRRRPPLLGLGVALWSAATALSAAAGSFGALLAARATVGIGEAAYGTISPGLLADHFEPRRRGRAFALFFMAIPVGAALGYVLGGVADRLAGWRAAFLVAGLPGLGLALAAARLPDPPRRADDGGAPPAPGPVVAAYRRLARNRGYALVVLGYAAYTAGVGAMAFWMPPFLERVRGLGRATATTGFGAVVLATGLVGTLGGGAAADALRRRSAAADLWLSGLTALAAAPLAWIAFGAASPAIAWPALVAAQLFAFASTGPVNAAIVEAVEPRDRASAMALSILAIHALGDVPSPALVGWLSDRSSLARAVLLVPATLVLAGAVWTLAAVRAGRAAQPPLPPASPATGTRATPAAAQSSSKAAEAR